jgi:hypothetical protein
LTGSFARQSVNLPNSSDLCNNPIAIRCITIFHLLIRSLAGKSITIDTDRTGTRFKAARQCNRDDATGYPEKARPALLSWQFYHVAREQPALKQTIKAASEAAGTYLYPPQTIPSTIMKPLKP